MTKVTSAWADLETVVDAQRAVLAQADDLARARTEAKAAIRHLRRLLKDQIAPRFDLRLSVEIDRLVVAGELLR